MRNARSSCNGMSALKRSNNSQGFSGCKAHMGYILKGKQRFCIHVPQHHLHSYAGDRRTFEKDLPLDEQGGLVARIFYSVHLVHYGIFLAYMSGGMMSYLATTFCTGSLLNKYNALV